MDVRVDPPEWLQWDQEAIKAHDTRGRYYRYAYGIKDIQIKNKKYEMASVYVTKPIVLDGNIAEVSLETDDYNQAMNNLSTGINPFDTSIEYYISFKEVPALEDWIPILPKNETFIENELLLFENASSAPLRFACDTSREISVFKNGIKLNKQIWSFGNNAIHIDSGFDKYSKYSIQYYPDINSSSPWDIELKEKDREIVPFTNPDGSMGEVFKNGTDRNGCITLSRYPYIDYTKINTQTGNSYRPISVELENASIAIPGNKTLKHIGDEESSAIVKTRNITDYKYLSYPTLFPYNMEIDLDTGSMINPFLEYYQDGKKLYFTETFNNTHVYSNMTTNHGEADIKVKYEYLRAKIRFKIILRNTSNKGSFTTPTIDKYNLIFKVIR